MSSDDKKRQSRWNRFNDLFDLPELERRAAYNQENVVFLEKFVSIEMNNYRLPEIENAGDFSEVIVVLRMNYRQWNQRLTGLLVTHDKLRDLKSKKNVDEFIETCPWNMLVDVGRNTPS
ncbi:hypothetical protein [Undibacterium pigrum]|uniref:Uncharacterized protein n=1 Tax=Undibacterium pigrum TaxID=401470 RepID=A0A318J1V7_9BURK|nr:hypothetical protein [Undibacterium pigrum]PXX41384.1 hypothetical protein DFR42_10735 [Undibacterium pigrum]